jgi:hypothetical protein
MVWGSVAPTAMSHTKPQKRTTGISGAANNATRLSEESSPVAAMPIREPCFVSTSDTCEWLPLANSPAQGNLPRDAPAESPLN